MITFVGIKYQKITCLLVMRNQRGQEVEIPINREVASVIAAHLSKLSDISPVLIESLEEEQQNSE